MNEILMQMLNLLTGAYTKSPDSNIGRLFSIFADTATAAQNTLITIKDWRDINQAKGSTLDRMGANFGVSRGTSTDNFYRLLIKVKMTSSLSGGDIDTLIRAIAVCLNIETAGVNLVEEYPAKVAVYVDEFSIEQEYLDAIEQTMALIFRLIAAGVGKRIVLKENYEAPITVGVSSGVSKTDHITAKPPKVRIRSELIINIACAAITSSHYIIKPMEV